MPWWPLEALKWLLKFLLLILIKTFHLSYNISDFENLSAIADQGIHWTLMKFNSFVSVRGLDPESEQK